MVVKDKAGRNRYILVGIRAGGMKRSHFIHHINRRFGPFRRREGLSGDLAPPWLTVLDPDYAIFRCPHTTKDNMVKFLNGLEIPAVNLDPSRKDAGRLRVLKVSGTMKKLKTKMANYRRAEDGRNG